MKKAIIPILLALAWFSSAQAVTIEEATEFDGLIGVGPGGTCFVTSTGAIVNQSGSGLLSGGGYSWCASAFSDPLMNTIFYGIKNGVVYNNKDSTTFPGSGYVSLYTAWLGGICAYKADGTGYCKTSSIAGYQDFWPSGYPSTPTNGAIFYGAVGTNFDEWGVLDKNGLATFGRINSTFNGSWTSIADIDKEQTDAYVLSTTGAIFQYNGIAGSFTGSYVEIYREKDISAATTGFCAIKSGTNYPQCVGSVTAAVNRTPTTTALRGIKIAPGGGTFYAIRQSDNKFVYWDSSNNITALPFEPLNPESIVEYSDGLVCQTTNYPNLNDVSWMTPGFFSLTGSYTRTDYPGESQYACNDHISYTTCGDKINIYNKSPNELSLDRFNAYNYSAAETLIFSGSWQYPAVGSRSVMVRDPEFRRYLVALGSIRNSANVQSNVFQFFSVANPSPAIPWGGVWSPESREWESVWASDSGVATIAWDFGISDIILQIRDMSVPPLGFRRGTANSFLQKTDCSKGTNACESYLRGTELVCAGKFENGYLGDCEFDFYGRCAPVARSDGSYVQGTPAEGSKVVYDSQGNVVVVIPESSAVNPNSGKVDGNSIFHCEDGEGYISCILTVLRNGWQAINDTFSSADSVGNSVENVTSRIGSGSSGSLYTGTFGTGSSEPIGERVISGGWNMISGDAGDDPFRLLIKRIWTSSIFVLFFFAIMVLYAVIRRRKENSNPEA